MEIIKLNIIPNGVTPVCHASQFDVKRKIRAELFELNDPYTLSGEETVTLNVRKPDKTIVTMTLTNTADNYVEFETTEQMCAVYGENKCEIKISYDDMTIGSLNFIMQVERDPLYQGITSESEIENLQTQVDTAVAVAVASQYDSSNVIFDSEPTLNNDIPYTVTSDGIKRALNKKADLSALQAQNISYDNTQSGLTADDVQEAIDEVLGEIPEIPSTYAASAVTYDNTQSGLSSNNAQDAIDELETEISNIPTSYDANEIGYDNTSSGLTATDAQGAIDEVLGSIPSSLAASAITYDNTSSGLTATDAQGAIDEVLGSIPSSLAASAITYDNTSSGLTADDAQEAIDELNTAIGGKVGKTPTAFNITAGTGITIQYQRCCAFGELKFISLYFSASSSAGAQIGTVPSDYKAKGSTFFPVSKSGGSSLYAYLATNSTSLQSDGAIAAGNYMINGFYW